MASSMSTCGIGSRSCVAMYARGLLARLRFGCMCAGRKGFALLFYTVFYKFVDDPGDAG